MYFYVYKTHEAYKTCGARKTAHVKQSNFENKIIYKHNIIKLSRSLKTKQICAICLEIDYVHAVRVIKNKKLKQN